MKKAILITLAPVLLADAYVTYSMNNNILKMNEALAAPQTKRSRNAKNTLMTCDGDEADHGLLIKTPLLHITNKPAQQPKHMNQQIDLKVFF